MDNEAAVKVMLTSIILLGVIAKVSGNETSNETTCDRRRHICLDPPNLRKQYLRALHKNTDYSTLNKITFGNLMEVPNHGHSCPQTYEEKSQSAELGKRATCSHIEVPYTSIDGGPSIYPHRYSNQELCFNSSCTVILFGNTYRGNCEGLKQKRVILQQTDRCTEVDVFCYYIYEPVVIDVTVGFMCALPKPTANPPPSNVSHLPYLSL